MSPIIYATPEQINKKIVDLPIQEYTEEEVKLIECYRYFCQRIEEINELFQVFEINRDLLLEMYILNSDDTIINKNTGTFTDKDYIKINALSTSCLSAVKNVLDAIQGFIENLCGQESDAYKSFKNKIAYIYDNSPYYQLFYELRNISQHGHLSLSYNFQTGKICILLNRLVELLDFNIKKKMARKLHQIIETIRNDYGDVSRMMFALPFAEYCFVVMKLYQYYIEEIIPYGKTLRKKFLCLAENKIDKELYPLFIYDEGDTRRLIDINVNPVDVLKGYKSYVSKGIEKETDLLKDFLQDNKFIDYSCLR